NVFHKILSLGWWFFIRYSHLTVVALGARSLPLAAFLVVCRHGTNFLVVISAQINPVRNGRVFLYLKEN
ncbi:hypothetical protein, partial [Photobacterium phosphoreum]|uniref:hypothetical protein n=1 Tax=Photobacterium phosphoreum TaxID=659 RepID=UPI001960DA6C